MLKSGLRASVGTRLGGQCRNWTKGILVIHTNEEDHKFEKHHRKKLCIFFLICFLLTRKDSITIHMSEEGFDRKGEKYFI